MRGEPSPGVAAAPIFDLDASSPLLKIVEDGPHGPDSLPRGQPSSASLATAEAATASEFPDLHDRYILSEGARLA